MFCGCQGISALLQIWRIGVEWVCDGQLGRDQGALVQWKRDLRRDRQDIILLSSFENYNAKVE